MIIPKAQQKIIYAKLKPKWMALNPICCVLGCCDKTKDLHHVNGRGGILLIVASLFRPLCRTHHDRLKQPGGVEWGRKNGLLPAVGGHNTCPVEIEAKYRDAYVALLLPSFIDWILYFDRWDSH